MTNRPDPPPPPRHRLAARAARRVVAFGLGLAVSGVAAVAWAGAPLPKQFETVDVKNKLGERVDLALPLVDHRGQAVRLGDFLDGQRPLLLTLNYYRCTSMCSAQLNELLDAVKRVGWVPGGDEFQMLTVSFDPRDDTEIAAGKRMTYLTELARAVLADEGAATDLEAVNARAETLGWTFATASERSIRALMDRLGYSVFYDASSGQYAHSPVVYVLAPDGVIARYLHGITYPPRDLRFALMEASGGRIGSFGEKVLLSCFAFDPDSGGYHAFAWGFMRIGGSLLVVIIGSWLLILFRRERRSRRLSPRLTGSSLRGSSSPV